MTTRPCARVMLSLGGWFLAVTLVNVAARADAAGWSGTWRSTQGETQQVLLVVDGYMALTRFASAEPAFHHTHGGPFSMAGDVMSGRVHFDSLDAGRVGQSWEWYVTREGDTLQVRREDGTVERWQREAEERGELTGVWRISGRQRDGTLQPMPLRARRTLKVLSGSWFQWIAMNIETGEFSGTGGGTYTFRNGVYVEEIKFFSRDPSRVGARLEFEGEVRDGDWQHRGLSSRGEPIHEVWTRVRPGE